MAPTSAKPAMASKVVNSEEVCSSFTGRTVPKACWRVLNKIAGYEGSARTPQFLVLVHPTDVAGTCTELGRWRCVA